MKAAVITNPGQPPEYRDIEEPAPAGPGQVAVQVLAAGLHHLTRARAAATHYSAAGAQAQVAGVDGVGRGIDGRLRYFIQAAGRPGTMAERTVIDLDHCVELPDGCDPVVIAAAMNPAMASWLALRRRAPSFRSRLPFRRRRRVLVLGATGSAGSFAVQVARHLGASQVIAAGRDPDRLAKLHALGATHVVTLWDHELGALAREVDVVLDFIWGEPSTHVMEAVLRRRADRGRPLDWIHVGSMAGDIAPLPGAFLRAAKLQLLGSGHGAVSGREILAELPTLVAEIARGTFHIEARALPLGEVARAWADDTGTGRIVFTP